MALVHNIIDITVVKGWSDQSIHSWMRAEINVMWIYNRILFCLIRNRSLAT